MTTQLVPLQEVERLSSRVIRILGGNPGKFTLQGTNTYLIGTGSHRLLIDTGEGKPSWSSAIRSVLASENASISSTILTHWHPDHIGGVLDILSASPSTTIFKNQSELHGNTAWTGIDHGQRFETEGATLRAVHSPGHTVDHMALVLEEEDAMFTGDNVLGHGTAVFEDLATYMKSLELMVEEFRGRAYPAHGDVIEHGPAKIHEYIAHRQERERQVLGVLSMDGEDGKRKAWTSMEIVKLVYKDYPESLHIPAEGGVKQVLGKLHKDGKVAEVNSKWRLGEKPTL